MPTLLTAHFALEELVGSTARPASAEELASVPVLVRANLQQLAQLLERVRAAVGVPLVITSGFRSASENESVGGVKTSQHLQGAAADFVPQGMTSAAAWSQYLADAVGRGALGTFGQLIVYPVKLPGGKGWGHIHLSTTAGASSSNQVLVAIPNQAGIDTVFVPPGMATAQLGVPAASTATANDPPPTPADPAKGASPALVIAGVLVLLLLGLLLYAKYSG